MPNNGDEYTTISVKRGTKDAFERKYPYKRATADDVLAALIAFHSAKHGDKPVVLEGP
jgi:hypothetical protein